ncbi:kinase-like domain-containing protein, partial [Mycena vitilis]
LADFDQLLKLGKGASSEVVLVREKVTRQHYALKIAPRKFDGADIRQERNVMESIALLPNAPASLLPLAASWSDSTNFYMATRWCEGKDFSSLLANGQRFPADRVRAHASELVLAVKALHDMGIVHRDIKPANVFFTQAGHVVLGDFGLAKIFGLATAAAPASADTELDFDADPNASGGSFLKAPADALTTRERCGTLHYMSPAQHAGTDYAYDADTWALGLLLFRMFTGRMPFGEDADSHQDVHRSYAKDPVVFPAAANVPVLAQELILGLLAKDPQHRYTIEQAKAHPYFLGVDWEAAARHEGIAPWAPRAAFVPK